MATAEKPKPTDIAVPDCWPCWHPEGWEEAAEWSMADAETHTRGEAHAAAAHDLGWTEVRVWKRYVRFLTRQEVWFVSRGDSPVPDDWQPDEYSPVWEFVPRTHPDARPYWVVGARGDEPPPSPRPPTVRGDH